jgi:hypothetical protein
MYIANLEQNNITGNGIKYFFLIDLSQLKYITLSYNTIGALGANVLCRLKLPNLTTLYLCTLICNLGEGKFGN